MTVTEPRNEPEYIPPVHITGSATVAGVACRVSIVAAADTHRGEMQQAVQMAVRDIEAKVERHFRFGASS